MEPDITINPWVSAKKKLAIAAEEIDMNPNTLEYLNKVERSLIVSIPIRMDNGDYAIFEGYRVQHSTLRGPAKGGIRYGPNVTLDEIKALAFLMTCKTSLLGLPLGGSKGGVRVDPKSLSVKEIERITRRYTSEIINIIGPDIDILAPDMNTDSQVMAWIYDTYSVNKGRSIPGVVTGKPTEIGGSAGRSTAAGIGMYYVFEDLCKRENISMDGMKVAIQGFGKVGMTVAQILNENGLHIIAVSDSTGGIYSESGLNVSKMIDWKAQGNSLNTYSEDSVKNKTNKELLELKCDVLVPAAVENQIYSGDADNINCRILLEGANSPTTSKADKILNEKGIRVIPDILANSGGVIVSYFEYVQDIQSYFWDLDRINKEMKHVILNAFKEVYRISKECNVSMRTAAYMLAGERLAKTYELRGLFP
ncbi:MAG: Glu/Leu/Phe/Val dehydrogenase [Candidatus Lokiarchaeota archaeon]